MRHSLIAVGYLLAFSITSVTFTIWMLAYYNGGAVTIIIDAFDEKIFELALWVLVMPVITAGLVELIHHKE